MDNEKKERVEDLMRDLYIVRYLDKQPACLSINDKMFNYYIKKDIRFNELALYLYYNNGIKSKFNVDKILSAVRTKMPNVFKAFILNNIITDDINEIEDDKRYNMEFYLLRDSRLDYEDFLFDMYGKTLTMIGKKYKGYNYITTDMMADFRIKYLDEEINRIIVLRRKTDEIDQPEVNIIHKLDKDGNLIETYDDRNTCCVRNGFTKSALSKHLSGKRKSLGGFVYKEITIKQRKGDEYDKLKDFDNFKRGLKEDII